MPMRYIYMFVRKLKLEIPLSFNYYEVALFSLKSSSFTLKKLVRFIGLIKKSWIKKIKRKRLKNELLIGKKIGLVQQCDPKADTIIMISFFSDKRTSNTIGLGSNLTHIRIRVDFGLYLRIFPFAFFFLKRMMLCHLL